MTAEHPIGRHYKRLPVAEAPYGGRDWHLDRLAATPPAECAA